MAQDFELTMPTERAEKYLAKMAKAYDGTLPEPISNIDKYLKILAENGTGGSSGGGITPKKLENADLNTVTETGFYYGFEGHGCTNTPANAHDTDFSMIVVNGNGIAYQIFTRHRDIPEHRLFQRSIDFTDATDLFVCEWAEFATTEDCAVDSVLSETSTRPPQNAIVTKRLNEIESNSAKKTDLTAYLPKDGTAKKADGLSTGQLKLGYIYNSTNTATSGKTWARVAYCVVPKGYTTITMAMLVTSGNSGVALFDIDFRSNANNDGFEYFNVKQIITNFPKKVSINDIKAFAKSTSNGMQYEIWYNIRSIYGTRQFTCLAEQRYGGANSNEWKFETHTAADFEAAPPTDGTEATYSSCGVVSTAETLTDSGWDSSLELFSEVAASTLKCRLYGKLVEIRGSFTLNKPSQHTPFAKIPLKFRPSEEVFTIIQVNSASISNLNFPLEFMICPNGELVVDSGTGANLPANREVKVCVHYLID